SIQLSNVQSVALTRVVPNPAQYTPGSLPSELMLSVNLSVNWGAVAHIDLEPASCADEPCERDHGYTGAISAEPLSQRLRQAAGELSRCALDRDRGRLSRALTPSRPVRPKGAPGRRRTTVPG